MSMNTPLVFVAHNIRARRARDVVFPCYAHGCIESFILGEHPMLCVPRGFTHRCYYSLSCHNLDSYESMRSIEQYDKNAYIVAVGNACRVLAGRRSGAGAPPNNSPSRGKPATEESTKSDTMEGTLRSNREYSVCPCSIASIPSSYADIFCPDQSVK